MRRLLGALLLLAAAAALAWYLVGNSACHPMPPRDPGDDFVYMCVVQLADPTTREAWWKEPEYVEWYLR